MNSIVENNVVWNVAQTRAGTAIWTGLVTRRERADSAGRGCSGNRYRDRSYDDVALWIGGLHQVRFWLFTLGCASVANG